MTIPGKHGRTDMKYIKLTIDAAGTGIEEITGWLAGEGITAVEIVDPETVQEIISKKAIYKWDFLDSKLIQRRKERPAVIVYLDDEQENEQRISEITSRFGEDNVTREDTDDSQWKYSYKEHFHTVDLTADIIVRPSWEDAKPAEEGKKVIDLDPGMAFGTGTHETTSMCARLMEEAGCEGKKILDAGTGSGILAITAVLLGSSEVMGIDIDPEAVDSAEKNVEKNGCSGIVKIKQADLKKGMDFRADVIVANLVAELIASLAAEVAGHLTPGGIFISSGILSEKRQMVTDVLQQNDFRIIKIMDEGGWSAIEAEYEH